MSKKIKTDIIELINDEKNKLIQLVIKYSQSQSEKWKKIPYLMCLADGRLGWWDSAETVMRGYWPIRYNDYYGLIYIDLENGNLVCNVSDTLPAHNKYVLALASNLDELNADKKIQDLNKKISTPVPTYMDEKRYLKIQTERLEKLNSKFKNVNV